MAKTAMTNNTNNNFNDDLSLTGKPVLVQNQLGIFYGFLEKSDSRSGSALLRDGFKLSPDRHITFSQYLDFLSNEIDSRYDFANDSLLSEAMEEAERSGEDPDSIGLPDILSEYSLTPNEITITNEVFVEHMKSPSIAEYASEGVCLVQHRTSTHENSRYIQSTSPLISLTNIYAIVAISESSVRHEGLEYISEEISKDGWLDKEDISLYYDAVPPIVTFGIISDRSIAEISSILSLVDDLGKSKHEIFSEKVHELYSSSKTKSSDYIMSVASRLVKDYINEDLIESDIDHRRFTMQYMKKLINMPALVINSEQRTSLFKNLKKAQDNEQIK